MPRKFTQKEAKGKCKDDIKNKYCKDNGINLLRISYKDMKNINEIIKQKITNLK